MKVKKTAFPTLNYDEKTKKPNGHSLGISRLDYFAAKAMEATIGTFNDNFILLPKDVADVAYNFAEAMEAESKVRNK